MDLFTVFLVLFVAGTWALARLNVKRYYVVFLVKTQRGITLIDRIAGISPGFWKFLAEAAVVVSFGGLGAAYLSRHNRRRTLFAVDAVMAASIVVLLFIQYKLLYAVVACVVLLAALLSFHKAKSQAIDFLSCTALLYVLGSRTFLLLGVPPDAVQAILLGGSVFGLPAILLLGLWLNASSILSHETDVPGVSPLLPSSRDGNLGVSFPGYDIFIPWWHALVALVLTVVAHEIAHGILARAQKMRIKSTGILTFGILPIGAFVEPDDEEVKKRASIEKMRLFAAGSFANLMMCVFAALTYLSLTVLVVFSMNVAGLEIVGTIPGYPADNVIAPGTVLLAVDGKPPDSQNLFPDVRPGEDVTLTTDRGIITLQTVGSPQNASKAYIGIYSKPRLAVRESVKERFPFLPAGKEAVIAYASAVSFLLSLLKWIMFFNFNIALVNLIPIAPFDGWHMFKELLSAFSISEESSERIALGVLAFTAVLFLINLSPLGGRVISAFA